MTKEAGLEFRGYGLGAVVADYDNDGDPDLLVTNFGKNALFRNNGDKTFTTLPKKLGSEGATKSVRAHAFSISIEMATLTFSSLAT